MANDYGELIKWCDNEIKTIKKSKILFNDEQKMFKFFNDYCYVAYYNQIHNFLAEQDTDKSENEIQSLVKTVITTYLPVIKAKLDNWKTILGKQKAVEKIKSANYFIRVWNGFYEKFFALASFRSLTHFAQFIEWEIKDKEKVFKHSIDPFNDGGWTGVNYPFLFYFNRMVLKKDIKFMSKQLPTGYGKCSLATTKVLTPNGETMLKDLSVGDKVFSMQDNILVEKNVTNKWETRKKQVKITTISGNEIIVSPEHRLYTTNGYVQAQNLTINDYLYQVCTKIENCNTIDDNELFFASMMLFEGCCSLKNLYKFSQEDNEVLEKFKKCLNEIGLQYSTRYRNSFCELSVWSNNGKTLELLKKYNLFGCLAKKKKLPYQFFTMPLKQRYNFIGYMLATDGYIPKINNTHKGGNLVGITLASKELAYSIKSLLLTCGIYSTIIYKPSKYKKDGKVFDAWAINIPNEYNKVLLDNCYCFHKHQALKERVDYFETLKVKPYSNNTNYPKCVVENCKEFKKLVNKQFAMNNSFKKEIVENFNKKTGLLEDVVYKDFVWDRIKSIEYDETIVDMVDIEVEDTHNFIASNIVSHNSYSDTMAISWLLGINPNNDVLKVLGNPALVLTTTKGIVDIMTSKRFAMIFPKYQKYHEKDVNPRDMFSICRLKDGELTLVDGNKPLNLKVISKDTSIDGIRVRYLFLDDVCRSKDAENDKEHDKDINNFWNSWWKRNYNTNDFYIVVGGTAYSVNDIVSTLKRWYSKGFYRPSKVNKYTKLNEKGDCVFIAIPKLDWDTDESTYPQKFPTEEARQIRERNERSFMAMEQQMPQDPESTPLAWEKINTYRELPSDLTKGAYAVLDPARTGANYVSMPIHRVREEIDKYGAKIERHYLTDAIFRLSKMEDVYSDIVEKIKRHNIVRLHIENNTDTSLAFLLNTKLHEQGITFCVITESFSTENKDQKMKEVVYGNEGCFINNMVYPCFGMFAQSSEVGKFMRNLTSYSYNTKMDFDDGIDSECMYIERFVAKKMVNNKPRLLNV